MMSVVPLASEFDVGDLRTKWVAEWRWGKINQALMRTDKFILLISRWCRNRSGLDIHHLFSTAAPAGTNQASKYEQYQSSSNTSSKSNNQRKMILNPGRDITTWPAISPGSFSSVSSVASISRISIIRLITSISSSPLACHRVAALSLLFVTGTITTVACLSSFNNAISALLVTTSGIAVPRVHQASPVNPPRAKPRTDISNRARRKSRHTRSRYGVHEVLSAGITGI